MEPRRTTARAPAKNGGGGRYFILRIIKMSREGGNSPRGAWGGGDFCQSLPVGKQGKGWVKRSWTHYGKKEND